MTRVIVAVIVVAALASPAIANADPTPDQVFLSDLTWHGVSPKSGMSHGDWDAEAIRVGHEMCDRLATGESRRQIKDSASDSDLANTIIDAAEDAYCPTFKGKSWG